MFSEIDSEVHLANIARRFPELLVALGSPDLEDGFEPAACRVVEHPAGGSTFQVVLERRPTAREVLGLGQDGGALSSLSRLASEFEQLALCAHVQNAVEAATAAAPPPPRPPAAAPAAGAAAQGSLPPKRTKVQPGMQDVAPSVPVVPCFAPGPPVAAAASPIAGALLVAPVAAAAATATSSALPPTASSGGVQPASRNRERYSDRDTACERSPHSARGDRQVRQGGSDSGGSKCLGRTRGQRSLRIAITKVHQLQELGQPASPKTVVRRPKVWGSAKQRSVASPTPDLKADAIKERIEKKLRQMFSELSDTGKEVPGLQKRHSIE